MLLITGKNFLNHRKQSKETQIETAILHGDSRSFIGVIQEADENITQVAIGAHKTYQLLIEGLSSQNIKKLSKAQKKVRKLEENVLDLRNNLFNFIRKLEETSNDASRFYIDTLSYIQDIIEDIDYLVNISHEHINNNHSKLKLSQIRGLKEIAEVIDLLLQGSINAFEDNSLKKLGEVLSKKEDIISSIDDKINDQINITRTEDRSPKNTTLYFNILLKSKDLIRHKIELIDRFYQTTSKIKSTL